MKGKPKFKLGDYIETKYGSVTFRGYITKIEESRYIMTPDKGITLHHSRFRTHGDHICSSSKIKLINQNHFSDELFNV